MEQELVRACEAKRRVSRRLKDARTRLSYSRKDIIDLQDQRASLIGTVRRTRRRMETCEGKLRTAERATELLQSQLWASQRREGQLFLKHIVVRQAQRRAEDHLRDARDKMKAQAARIGALKGSLVHREVLLDDQQRQTTAIEGELASHKQRVRDERKKLNVFVAVCSTLDRELAAARADVAERDAKLGTAVKDREEAQARLRQRVVTARVDAKVTAAKHTKAIKSLKAELAISHAERWTDRAETHRKQAELQDHRAELLHKVESAKAMEDSLQTELTILHDRLEEAEKKHETASSEAAMERTRLLERAGAMEYRERPTRGELQLAQNELRREEEDHRAKETDLRRDLTAAKDCLRTAKEERERDASDARTQQQKLQERAEAAEKENLAVRAELESLKKENAQEKGANETLRNANKQLEDETDRLLLIISASREQLADAKIAAWDRPTSCAHHYGQTGASTFRYSRRLEINQG